MKRLLNWLKQEFAPDASAICWLCHSSQWRYVRHTDEIDDDVGEYYLSQHYLLNTSILPSQHGLTN